MVLISQTKVFVKYIWTWDSGDLDATLADMGLLFVGYSIQRKTLFSFEQYFVDKLNIIRHLYLAALADLGLDLAVEASTWASCFSRSARW